MAGLVRAFAPGRANLIGEHTDYNRGLALPFAVHAGVTVTARGLPRPEVRAAALDLGESDRFPLRAPEPSRGWRALVRGAVAELTAAGFPLVGTEVQITGTLPRGGGLSSSAALQVALCLALIALAGAEPPAPLELARICSRVENRWVGSRTGLLDQLASLCGQEGHLLLIDFDSLELAQLPLVLGGHRLVVVDSGQPHSNAAAEGYNGRRSECEAACRRLGVASLRELEPADTAMLPATLARRARHVVSENARVHETVAAIKGGDLVHVGELLDASHASLRDDYEVSTPAVEAAVERLRCTGALGARLVGGGFGGHVLGLLAPDCAPPDGATEVRPGEGAHLVG